MPGLKKIGYYLSAVPIGYLSRQLFARLRSLPGRFSATQSAYSPRTVARQSPLANQRLICPDQLNDRLASYLFDRYSNHRFDLLGSGWLGSGYDAVAPGLEGHVYAMNISLPPVLDDGAWLAAVVSDEHLVSSRALWCLLREIGPTYTPIDWQRDRKSGFRWSAQQPHSRQFQLSRGVAGADIIQPWELSRLQHLPQLALIALHQPLLRAKVLAEIQCQVLDFATANPVGMGVNWACTMDVAIRAANLVLTHWLLASAELHRQFHSGFCSELCMLIYRHGVFIRNNLEDNAGNAGNHYLANLTGLLFVTAFLEQDEDVREWERHAVKELVTQARCQFYDDGGHFEGASCYHALCTELLVFAVALAGGNRNALEVPVELYQAVSRSVDLLARMHSPEGTLIQIGDNDSGRLFRLIPRGDFIGTDEAKRRYQSLAGYAAAQDEPYFDENTLDFRDITEAFVSGTLGYQLLQALGKSALLRRGLPYRYQSPALTTTHAELGYHATRSFSSRGDLSRGLTIYCYPDSGLYFAVSDTLYLVLSAHTNPGQKLNLSHSHNDKLGLELYIDGAAVLTDPGSYLYTPLPQLRDKFRSVGAHNTLQLDGVEQNRFVDSFVSYADAVCELVDLTANAIELALTYRGVCQRRRVEISARAVTVTDSCNRPFRQNWNDFPWQSHGYGKLRSRL